MAASAGATRRARNGASAAAARLLLSVLRFVLPWFLVLQTISCLQISESEGFYLLTIESVYYHVNFNKKRIARMLVSSFLTLFFVTASQVITASTRSIEAGNVVANPG